MARIDYPADLRADRPERNSRLWAVLTILLIKFLALIPHFFILVFLGIAQWVVAFVAQILVAVRGEYPPGMFAFVVGVLRWSTRVSAFILSLSDRYPPFSLEPDPGYAVDIHVERPDQHSRVYAVFTVIVQILFLVGAILLAVYLVRRGGESGSLTGADRTWTQGFGTGMILRQLAAVPHYVILAFLGIAAFAVWFVVQWVILFTGSYPRGLYGFSVGVVRWEVRVQAYALGLIDRYPPFDLDQSAGQQAAGPVGGAPAAPALPAAPPPGAGQGYAPAAGQGYAPAAGQGYAPAAGPAASAGTAPPQQAGAAPPQQAAPAPAPVMPPAQWYPDPLGRHEFRYWDGSQWTALVADAGVQSTDPL